jgi:hypothetical protein
MMGREEEREKWKMKLYIIFGKLLKFKAPQLRLSEIKCIRKRDFEKKIKD